MTAQRLLCGLALASVLASCASAELAAETGEQCAVDDDCANGRCVQARDDERIHYCTEVCDGDGYCPKPMQCLANTCRFPSPSPGAIGAMCSVATDCLDEVCYTAPDNAGMCTASCTPGSDACPAGYSCQDTGSSNVCLTAPASDGCTAAGGNASTYALLVLCGIALVLRRRRSPKNG